MLITVIIVGLVATINALTSWKPWADCDALQNCHQRQVIVCAEGEGMKCGTTFSSFEIQTSHECENTTCQQNSDWNSQQKIIPCTGKCSQAVERREQNCIRNPECIRRIYYHCCNRITCTGAWTALNYAECSESLRRKKRSSDTENTTGSYSATETAQPSKNPCPTNCTWTTWSSCDFCEGTRTRTCMSRNETNCTEEMKMESCSNDDTCQSKSFIDQWYFPYILGGGGGALLLLLIVICIVVCREKKTDSKKPLGNDENAFKLSKILEQQEKKNEERSSGLSEKSKKMSNNNEPENLSADFSDFSSEQSMADQVEVIEEGNCADTKDNHGHKQPSAAASSSFTPKTVAVPNNNAFQTNKMPDDKTSNQEKFPTDIATYTCVNKTGGKLKKKQTRANETKEAVKNSHSNSSSNWTTAQSIPITSFECDSSDKQVPSDNLYDMVPDDNIMMESAYELDECQYSNLNQPTSETNPNAEYPNDYNQYDFLQSN